MRRALIVVAVSVLIVPYVAAMSVGFVGGVLFHGLKSGWGAMLHRPVPRSDSEALAAILQSIGVRNR